MSRPPVVIAMIVRSWLGVQKRFVVGLPEASFPASIDFVNCAAIDAESASIQFGALTGREMAQGAPIAPPNWQSIGAAPFPSPKGGLRKAQRPSQASTQPEGIRAELAEARAARAEKSTALATANARLAPITGRMKSLMEAMRATHHILFSDQRREDLLLFDRTRKSERAPMWAEMDAIRSNPATMALRKERNELDREVKAMDREIDGLKRHLEYLERKRSKKEKTHAA